MLAVGPLLLSVMLSTSRGKATSVVVAFTLLSFGMGLMLLASGEAFSVLMGFVFIGLSVYLVYGAYMELGSTTDQDAS